MVGLMVRFLNVRRVMVGGNLTNSWDAKGTRRLDGNPRGRIGVVANNRDSVTMVEELVNLYACALVVILIRMQVYVTNRASRGSRVLDLCATPMPVRVLRRPCFNASTVVRVPRVPTRTVNSSRVSVGISVWSGTETMGPFAPRQVVLVLRRRSWIANIAARVPRVPVRIVKKSRVSVGISVGKVIRI